MRRTATLFSLTVATLLAMPLQAQQQDATAAAMTPTFSNAPAPVGLLAPSRAALPDLPTAASRPTSGPNAPAPAPRADGFASGGFAQFMASPAGRLLRVVAGAGMIAGGLAADSDAGTAVAIVGAVPLLAGAFDFCVISPLFGGPFSGKAIRAAK